MARQAVKEVPRWKRGKQKPASMPVTLRGRHAKALTRELVKANQGTGGRKEGSPAAASANNALASTGAWRFRRHLQPFGWLAALLVVGVGLHRTTHPLGFGLLASLIVPVLMVAAARNFPAWVQGFTAAEAVATSVWLPLLAVSGLRPWLAWLLLTWAPFAGLWVRRYRWRPAPPQDRLAPAKDLETWAALCEEQKWRAHLGKPEALAGGGRRYPVQCDGVKTVMKKILAQPDNVAGAWHSPVTEAYAERDPKGVTSRGFLTILPGSSLQATGWWDGAGMDPETGLAQVGRFADGSPAHVKMYTPRYGCSHDLDSGTTGSGKSELLSLKIFIALQTGWFVPVILDPQEGQSLPFFRDRCIYASGVGEVERRLRGLHAGFMDRSSMLATYRWDDDGVTMPGMPFFDYELLGGALPMPWIILDEAHMVLKDGSRQQRAIRDAVLEMARLIRKAGGKMTLATQLPSLEDLGGKQALRDMLRGGNVWSGRTANKVAGGMLGLVKDPSEIPRFFGDGSVTAGLGYVSGPDSRPDAPMRTLRVGKDHYRNPPAVRQLDDRFLEVMDRAMRDAVSPTSAVAPVAAPRPAPVAGLGRMRPAPEVPAEPADDTPEGRRCVDAVWQVLSDRNAEMTRGEVIKWVGDLARSWGRKPWGIKSIQNALTDLAEGKDDARPVAKPRDGVYRAVAGDSARNDQETGAA